MQGAHGSEGWDIICCINTHKPWSIRNHTFFFRLQKKSFYVHRRVSPFYFLDFNSMASTMAARRKGGLCLQVFICSESGGKLGVSSTETEARGSLSLGGGRHNECNNRFGWHADLQLKCGVLSGDLWSREGVRSICCNDEQTRKHDEMTLHSGGRCFFCVVWYSSVSLRRVSTG